MTVVCSIAFRWEIVVGAQMIIGDRTVAQTGCSCPDDRVRAQTMGAVHQILVLAQRIVAVMGGDDFRNSARTP